MAHALEESLAQVRNTPQWHKTVEEARAILVDGFGQKPRAVALAAGRIRVHVFLGGRKHQIEIPSGFTKDEAKARLFRLAFVLPSYHKHLTDMVRAQLNKEAHQNHASWAKSNEWYEDSITASVRALAGDVRCDELTHQLWRLVEDASPDVAKKAASQKNRHARRRLKNAVEKAAAEGLSHTEMVEVVDECLVQTVMDR